LRSQCCSGYGGWGGYGNYGGGWAGYGAGTGTRAEVADPGSLFGWQNTVVIQLKSNILYNIFAST